MTERKSKPEIAAQKKLIKLAPAIGDWTTYKPAPVMVKKVKTGLYGFDRLSKEELNKFMVIHYHFIQDLLKQLRVNLRMGVELYTVQAEQTTYINFLRSMTGSMAQCKIDIPGKHDSISLFIELPLANSIINYSLGSIDIEPISRALTEAEQTTLATALAEYLPLLCENFDNSISNLSLSIVSSPDVIVDPAINPSSTFVAFTAELSLAENPPAKIIIAFQGTTLKPLLTLFRQKDLSKPLNFDRLPAKLLSKVQSSLLAKLGDTLLTTNEIKQLEIGDVVTLETSIDSPALATIGNLLTLPCQPGIKGKKAAVRILGFRESAEAQISPPQLAAEEKPEEIRPFPAPQPEKPKEAAPKIEEKIPPEELLPEEEFAEEFPEEEFPEEEFEEEFPEEEHEKEKPAPQQKKEEEFGEEDFLGDDFLEEEDFSDEDF
jgi:flagellar motor switch protein FliM